MSLLLMLLFLTVWKKKVQQFERKSAENISTQKLESLKVASQQFLTCDNVIYSGLSCSSMKLIEISNNLFER